MKTDKITKNKSNKLTHHGSYAGNKRRGVLNDMQKFNKRMSESEKTIHSQFTHAGRNAREWLRKCALLLPQIARKEIWRKKGFSGIHEYAAKIAGMSRSSVDESLRVLKHVENKPELKKVVEIFGIQRVRPVATIATEDTAAFWAKKAMDMSKNTLETYVREYKKEFADKTLPRETGKTEITTGSMPQKINITMDLNPEIAQKLLKLKGQDDWNKLMQQLLAEREQQIEKERPNTITTHSRHIPNKIKKYVVAKTNGQCAFPNCTKPHTSLHHTRRFALERAHDPDRITPLCDEHERIAHLGLIENEETPSKKWKLRRVPDKTDHKQQVDQMVWLYR